ARRSRQRDGERRAATARAADPGAPHRAVVLLSGADRGPVGLPRARGRWLAVAVILQAKALSPQEDSMSSLNVPLYDPRLVQPMREELTRIGFRELRTPHDVDAVLGKTKDSALVVVNSVCGCAARNARPAAALVVQHAKRPKQLLTV